jgi:hypothetical protein
LANLRLVRVANHSFHRPTSKPIMKSSHSNHSVNRVWMEYVCTCCGYYWEKGLEHQFSINMERWVFLHSFIYPEFNPRINRLFSFPSCKDNVNKQGLNRLVHKADVFGMNLLCCLDNRVSPLLSLNIILLLINLIWLEEVRMCILLY